MKTEQRDNWGHRDLPVAAHDQCLTFPPTAIPLFPLLYQTEYFKRLVHLPKSSHGFAEMCFPFVYYTPGTNLGLDLLL